MKKFFVLAAAAALTLASCAKVETITKVNDDQKAISFSNYAPKALVKADSDYYVASTTLINNADFDVWGWYTANDVSFNGSNGTAYFSDSNEWYTVTYKTGGNADGATNVYPDGARYWPTGETPDKLSFYAYYPSNASGITAPDGLGAFTFTTQAAAADQVDFMVADVVKDQLYEATNSGTNGTVNLNFKHQLTKVQVKFRTSPAIVNDANTNIVVNSASFKNIVKSGTLTSSYDGSATSTVWSNNAYVDDDAILADYTIAVPAGNLTATAANSGVEADDIFLLVPQDMLINTNPKAQYITVTWTVTTNGVPTQNTKKIYLKDAASLPIVEESAQTNGAAIEGEVYEQVEEGAGGVKCQLADGTVVYISSVPATGTADTVNHTYYKKTGEFSLPSVNWAKNNFVTYIITIAPNQILFTAEATEWDAETFGHYNIF